MALNSEIIRTFIDKFKTLSLANQPNRGGKFFADKSYAFDTLFFCSRFISRFRIGNKFYKSENQSKSNKYIQDLFCLRTNKSQIGNYMTETVALLCFTKVLERVHEYGRGEVYKIIDDDALAFISTSFENAYIYQYLLAYQIFKNEDLWDLYKRFCSQDKIEEKQKVYDIYRPLYAKKDVRVKDPTKGHAFFTPKFPMIVLNYINQQNMCTRQAKVKNTTVRIEDISLNQEGKRAGNFFNNSLPKKNAYLQDFSTSYVVESLRPYLICQYGKFEDIQYSDSFSIDLADVKLDMLDEDNSTYVNKVQLEKYKISGGNKVRTVQGEFKRGLKEQLPHKCPICGFHFDQFLIASHIKPYAKCDDTYDAMNPSNGFLMCPICDKLFESGRFLTIDAKSWAIKYDSTLNDKIDFDYLKNKQFIDRDYQNDSRKKFLEWHNLEFDKKHL